MFYIIGAFFSGLGIGILITWAVTRNTEERMMNDICELKQQQELNEIIIDNWEFIHKMDEKEIESFKSDLATLKMTNDDHNDKIFESKITPEDAEEGR